MSRANSPFRLITFDLDDTLWPCEPVIRAAEQAQLDWLQAHAPALVALHDAASLREHRRQLMQARPDIAHDLGALRRLSIAGILESLGHAAEEAEALAHSALDVFMAHRNRVEPYPDVAPALTRLGAGRQLISITNGNADPEQTPLAGLFAHRIDAAGIGAAKPDPRVFEHALALAGCDAGDCLHVGDEPYLDVAAARALGMESAWINRAGRAWPDDLEPPPPAFSDLGELADWLDGQIAPRARAGRHGL
jgi:putative hydrolase of the HAD superfamily